VTKSLNSTTRRSTETTTTLWRSFWQKHSISLCPGQKQWPAICPSTWRSYLGTISARIVTMRFRLRFKMLSIYLCMFLTRTTLRWFIGSHSQNGWWGERSRRMRCSRMRKGRSLSFWRSKWVRLTLKGWRLCWKMFSSRKNLSLISKKESNFSICKLTSKQKYWQKDHGQQSTKISSKINDLMASLKKSLNAWNPFHPFTGTNTRVGKSNGA